MPTPKCRGTVEQRWSCVAGGWSEVMSQLSSVTSRLRIVIENEGEWTGIKKTILKNTPKQELYINNKFSFH